MKSNEQPSLDQVIDWAKQAGRIAREGFLMDHQVAFKSPRDVVTEIDHACEKLLMDAIKIHFHDDAILTEESGAMDGKTGDCWFIDPLDGTVNYSHRLPIYSVSIAYQTNGKLTLGVVYDPSRDECFSAERGKGAWLNGEAIHVSGCNSLLKSLLVTGFPYNDPEIFAKNLILFGQLTQKSQGVRRLGSAALDVCYVACGRFDGYWEQGINAWDIAAGALIVEEAGGIVTGLDGSPGYFKPPYAIIASAPGIHHELLEILNPHL
jgi:myo-inositol-1(or 4)-monophosphatase